MGMLWLGNENIRGTPSDERGLRVPSSKLDWWEQLHHFYVLVALTGTGAGFVLGATFKERVLLFFVGGYVLVVAIFAAWSAFVNGNKARYAPLMTHIHSGMHTLRNLRVAMQSELFYADVHTQDVLSSELTRVLDSFRSSLEIVSGTTIECRIELIQRPKGSSDFSQLISYALCRDSISSERRRHLDEDARRTHHKVMGSTPYMSLLHGDGAAFYFCGNVNAQQDFQCEYFRRFPKDLKPRSMVVWPIRYRRKGGDSPPGHPRPQEIVGFLHAESVSKAAFTRRYDVELGAAFADSLFDVLFSYVRHKPEVVHAIFD